jgi:aryl-alcohol dehydrogenase-like predicted oxidoreductase
MSELNRRNFIAAAGAAAGLSVVPSVARAAAAPPRPPQISLGNTGITMSRVGQGTGVHGGNRQSNQTRMGFEKLVSLFRHSYDRGITFFDLADLYGTHVYFREALRSIPRDEVTILTKVWWRYDGKISGKADPECKSICDTTLQRFRHELTTDYIDIVLLHCMQTPKWTEELEPYMESLNEAKEKKQVRAVGVSCHNLEALEVAAECPWVDVILARINPKGVKMDAATDKVVPVLKKAKENGKAILGMKIFGEGQLASEREACIKFAQGLGLLDAMTIGFEQPEQVDDVLNLINQFPVT